MTPYCQQFHLSVDDFYWGFFLPAAEPVLVCIQHNRGAPDWVYDEEIDHTIRNIEQLMTGQVS